ncbi:MAG TPA: hypothetical protein VFQ63_03785 [Patescibacteria group bacterium]|nr:hypothetical protein [Patescibacteria group bacterium]
MNKHFLYYVSLVAALVSGVILVWASPQHPQTQMTIVVAMGFVYVVWGTLHHLLHHSFRVKIMLEYVAVAAIGAALVLFILKAFV